MFENGELPNNMFLLLSYISGPSNVELWWISGSPNVKNCKSCNSALSSQDFQGQSNCIA